MPCYASGLSTRGHSRCSVRMELVPIPNLAKGFTLNGGNSFFMRSECPERLNSGAHGTGLLPCVTGECSERFKSLTKFGVNSSTCIPDGFCAISGLPEF